MNEYVDPYISDAMFEITCNSDVAYADDAEGAYAAYWQLRNDVGIWGVPVRIKNLVTGQVVINQ